MCLCISATFTMNGNPQFRPVLAQASDDCTLAEDDESDIVQNRLSSKFVGFLFRTSYGMCMVSIFVKFQALGSTWD